MLSENEDLFKSFQIVHEKFAQNQEEHKKEFNRIGQQVLVIIRKYENELVGSTERSQYSKFSSKLSDKFWQGIRTIFPKIDYIGIK